MMAIYKNEPKLVFSMSFQAGRRFVAAKDVKMPREPPKSLQFRSALKFKLLFVDHKRTELIEALLKF